MKIRKCRGFGEIIEAALLKSASMDVMIDGYRGEDKKDDILDLCHYLFDHSINALFPSLPKEETDYWRASYGNLESISPDGNSAFQKTGIINFYTRGLSYQRSQQLLTMMIEALKKIGVRMGPVKGEPWGSDKPKGTLTDIRVYRIPVIDNPNDSSKQDIPPDLNMANSNAVHIFQKVLKYPQDASLTMDAGELLKRVNFYLGEQALPENYNPNPMLQIVPPEDLEPWQKVENPLGLPARQFDPTKDKSSPLTDAFLQMFKDKTLKSGYESDDVKRQLGVIKQICEWALAHGFQRIYVA